MRKDFNIILLTISGSLFIVIERDNMGIKGQTEEGGFELNFKLTC